MKTVVMCVRATCSHAVLFKRSFAGCSIEIRRGGVGLADRSLALSLALSLSPTAVHHDPTKKEEQSTRSSSAQTGEGVQNARPEWAAGWQYRDDAKVEAACRSGDQCRVLSLLPEPEPEPWTRGRGGGWLSRRPALIGSIVATDQPPMLCDGHKRCLCATSLHLSHLPSPSPPWPGFPADSSSCEMVLPVHVLEAPFVASASDPGRTPSAARRSYRRSPASKRRKHTRTWLRGGVTRESSQQGGASGRSGRSGRQAGRREAEAGRGFDLDVVLIRLAKF